MNSLLEQMDEWQQENGCTVMEYVTSENCQMLFDDLKASVCSFVDTLPKNIQQQFQCYLKKVEEDFGICTDYHNDLQGIERQVQPTSVRQQFHQKITLPFTNLCNVLESDMDEAEHEY